MAGLEADARGAVLTAVADLLKTIVPANPSEFGEKRVEGTGVPREQPVRTVPNRPSRQDVRTAIEGLREGATGAKPS